MQNSFLSFYIKYVDGNDKIVTKHILFSEIGDKSVKNPNTWFYEFASHFSCKNELAIATLKRLFNNKKSVSKNPENYEKKYKKAYEIKELIDLELLINDRYVEKEYSPIMGSKYLYNYYQLPILYSDSYYRENVEDRENWELLSEPQDFDNPLKALKKALHLYSSHAKKFGKDQSQDEYIRKQALAFRDTIAGQTADFLNITLHRIESAIQNNPYIQEVDKKYRIKRIESVLDNKKHETIADFINDVLVHCNKDKTDILLLSNGSYDQNKFMIFLVNIINQIQTHELSMLLDDTGLFNKPFIKSDYLHTQMCKDLVSKSVAEVYNENVKRQQQLILAELSVQSKIDCSQNSIDNDLIDYYRLQYPDLSDEEIMDIIQPDHNDSFKNNSKLKYYDLFEIESNNNDVKSNKTRTRNSQE